MERGRARTRWPVTEQMALATAGRTEAGPLAEARRRVIRVEELNVVKSTFHPSPTKPQTEGLWPPARSRSFGNPHHKCAPFGAHAVGWIQRPHERLSG